MSRRPLCLGLGFLMALAGCERRLPPAPLGPDEEALVQTYVRLAVLQALHEDAPDSSETVLREFGASVDTVAVRRALSSLSQDPLRWEAVHGAIASRLDELESTPALWWNVAAGDTSPPPPNGPAVEPARVPTGRTPAPDR